MNLYKSLLILQLLFGRRDSTDVEMGISLIRISSRNLLIFILLREHSKNILSWSAMSASQELFVMFNFSWMQVIKVARKILKKYMFIYFPLRQSFVMFECKYKL